MISTRRSIATAMGVLAVAMLWSVAPAHASVITRFDIANNAGKNLVFTKGGKFTFQDEVAGNTNDFTITLEDGGTGGLVGLRGDIDGTFSFGKPLGASSVVVTSPLGAVFTIGDGAGHTFSAPISLVELTEFNAGPIHLGGLSGSVVLGKASYKGTNPDLLTLAQQPVGDIVISFQQVHGTIDLDTIFAKGYTTSWSGSLTPTNPTPEPGSALLLGSGIVGVALAARRKNARNRQG